MDNMQNQGHREEEKGGMNTSSAHAPGGGQKKEGGQWTPVIVAILIILVGAFLYSRSATAPADESEIGMEPDISKAMDEIENSGMLEGEVLGVRVSPEEWDLRDRAEEIINSTQGKTRIAGTFEVIQDGIIQDEESTNLFYFATADNNSNANFVGVYRFDTSNNRWWRATKLSFVAKQGEPLATLRVIKKEGRNLILLQDQVGRTPEICESPLLQGEEHGFALLQLNLDTPLDGLQPYELTNAMRNTERQTVTECQKG